MKTKNSTINLRTETKKAHTKNKKKSNKNLHFSVNRCISIRLRNSQLRIAYRSHYEIKVHAKPIQQQTQANISASEPAKSVQKRKKKNRRNPRYQTHHRIASARSHI